jgi:dTDP-4-dehydrorhamnose reductase
VDRAESEPDLAYAINSGAVRVMAEEARQTEALLVHYSTDYVFDGSKPGAYTEEDAPNPLSVYGSTKLEGERAIEESACRHLILRASWVYGTRGGNFPRAILRAARERDRLTVVDDQFGSPTSADLLADVTAHCVEHMTGSPAQYPCGVYHLTASGRTSWYAYAKFLLDAATQAGLHLQATSENVEPISSERYGAAAKRPANSTLDTAKLRQAFAIELPHWTEDLTRFVEHTAAESSV